MNSMESKPECTFYKYLLPSENGEGWGEIIISSSGMFAAVTDYGNYAYLWTNHGCSDIREFVARLGNSPDYLASKLEPIKKYDGPLTVRAIKNRILEGRRGGEYSQEFAKKEWDLLTLYESDILDGIFGLNEWMEDTGLGDAWECTVYSHSVDVRHFCKKLMPRLAELIRKELTEKPVYAL